MISLGGGGLTEGVDSGRPLGDPSGYNSWQSTLASGAEEIVRLGNSWVFGGCLWLLKESLTLGSQQALHYLTKRRGT